MQQSSPFKMVVTLFVVCMVAGGGLSLTYAATKDQIARQKKIDEAKAFMTALPSVKRVDDFVPMADVTKAARGDHPELVNVLKGGSGADVKGYVVQIGPRGYGGPVVMAVGLTPDGEITNIAVISSNETPGLGTQALEPDFVAQLKGKSASDPIAVGKDVDAITGATRSSDAITAGASKAARIFKDYIRR